MKKLVQVFAVLTLIVSVSACASRKVTRVDSGEVIDLSGRWNDTDSRLVSNEMIKDLLGAKWIPIYENQHNNKRPVVVVGTILNKSHEHIDAEMFIKDIEKGIMDSEVGITPENNGEVIRLGIPPLTEERRRLLAKQSKQEAETAKISIRNARRDAIEQLKKSIKTDGTPEDVEKDAEAEVQKVHDKYIKKVDELYAAKEKEIMTV